MSLDAGHRRRKGLAAEANLSRRLGLRQVRGSGSQQGWKGDVIGDLFLIESKSTSNRSLGVKLAWLDKISKEALGRSRTPALAVQFVDEEGQAVRGGSWIMVPETTFKELTE